MNKNLRKRKIKALNKVPFSNVPFKKKIIKDISKMTGIPAGQITQVTNILPYTSPASALFNLLLPKDISADSARPPMKSDLDNNSDNLGASAFEAAKNISNEIKNKIKKDLDIDLEDFEPEEKFQIIKEYFSDKEKSGLFSKWKRPNSEQKANRKQEENLEMMSQWGEDVDIDDFNDEDDSRVNRYLSIPIYNYAGIIKPRILLSPKNTTYPRKFGHILFKLGDPYQKGLVKMFKPEDIHSELLKFVSKFNSWAENKRYGITTKDILSEFKFYFTGLKYKSKRYDKNYSVSIDLIGLIGSDQLRSTLCNNAESYMKFVDVEIKKVPGKKVILYEYNKPPVVNESSFDFIENPNEHDNYQIHFQNENGKNNFYRIDEKAYETAFLYRLRFWLILEDL